MRELRADDACQDTDRTGDIGFNEVSVTLLVVGFPLICRRVLFNLVHQPLAIHRGVSSNARIIGVGN
jgi:hypothetical protein